MAIHRHQHSSAPRMQTPQAIEQHNFTLATDKHVYHPTKGWRKSRRLPDAGHQKIERFLARAF